MTLSPDAITLVTIVRGRHDHLRRQLRWARELEPRPARHVLVAMGDPQIADLVAQETSGAGALPTTVLGLDVPEGAELPLSAARNAGVRAATGAGAQVVALLDVDCLPQRRLIADYARALDLLPDDRPQVVTGRVRYLPEGMGEVDFIPDRVETLAQDHPVRTVPAPGDLEAADPRLLWSLNIALRTADWDAVGGFDERYTGYGGEDTDFGQRLGTAGGRLWWYGGAEAFHQHHPVSDPPVEHAAAIARNANLFRATWGFEPMDGWISALIDLGHLERDPEGQLRSRAA